LFYVIEKIYYLLLRNSSLLPHIPIHIGLTVLPETAKCFHGTKVAYGILVQLALEEKFEGLQQFTEALNFLGLPTCLSDFDVDFSNTF